MTRVKRGSVARRRRRNVIKITSGFEGVHSKLFRTANQQGVKASASARLGRINRKREIRRLWVARINAAARRNKMTYKDLIHNLYKNQVCLNRKILAQIAILDTNCFSKVVRTIRV